MITGKIYANGYWDGLDAILVKNDDQNPDASEQSFSSEESEPDSNTVETSPLIPDWANQTENPAFFQNLDIPTFLRRRGSSRPRQ